VEVYDLPHCPGRVARIRKPMSSQARVSKSVPSQTPLAFMSDHKTQKTPQSQQLVRQTDLPSEKDWTTSIIQLAPS